ncbi:hypothetical protein [Shewanella sp. CG12_big_fil_rev_8_21_14_0_65_47_15]|uniref:hypothetical protein n=1 Tax=Shewanella sp. CG12_big_fil_rev_8_21_14_0_65_47_15 TaxID=1975537 RepID=UPI0025F78302|nr:hypothetical protein [Shewanella sp. CG12_big_fil_rev_8_21_14_0_65_47_15]
MVADGTDLQAYNRYSYVRNNPLNAVDPSGYNPVVIIAQVIGALVAAKVAADIVVVAYYIYVIYTAVDTIYNSVQAFKYGQGGFGAVFSAAMAAYGAVSGLTSMSSAKGTGTEGAGGKGGRPAYDARGGKIEGMGAKNSAFEPEIFEDNSPFTESQIKELDKQIELEKKAAKTETFELKLRNSTKSVSNSLREAFGTQDARQDVAEGFEKIHKKLDRTTAINVKKITQEHMDTWGKTKVPLAAAWEGNIYISKTYLNQVMSGQAGVGTLIHETAHLVGFNHYAYDGSINSGVSDGFARGREAAMSRSGMAYQTRFNPYNYEIYLSARGYNVAR